MTSLFCSASTTASCTHFIAVSKSTISPLRTPRDGAWPTPKIFVVPSGRLSPTTTQILDVPISNPTIKSLLAISFFLFLFHRHRPLHRWAGARRRLRFSFRKSAKILSGDRDRFHHPRGFVQINGLVDHFGGRFSERDRN